MIQRASGNRPARVEDIIVRLAHKTTWVFQDPNQHNLCDTLSECCDTQEITALLSDKEPLKTLVKICQDFGQAVGMSCQGQQMVFVSPCVACNTAMDRQGGCYQDDDAKKPERPRSALRHSETTLQAHVLSLVMECLSGLLEPDDGTDSLLDMLTVKVPLTTSMGMAGIEQQMEVYVRMGLFMLVPHHAGFVGQLSAGVANDCRPSGWIHVHDCQSPP